MRNPSPKIPTSLDPVLPGEESRWIHEVACRECCLCTQVNRVLPKDLEEFTARVLAAHGAPEGEARVVARNLVSAEERGIPSHGVARLGRYLDGIRKGTIRPGAEMKVTEPAPAIGLVDAGNGLGQVAGELGMNLAIRKAKANGIGAVTVRNSNHYGIAGYYALMAAEQGMIGISLTNSAPLVVPTFGAELMLGTNPISFGAPAGRHAPFLLDMATSVVSRGKIEVHDRTSKQLPIGWAVDENGFDCENPGQILKNLLTRAGGGILPLGGRGERLGGYKGYGLALMVDVLCGVLSGGAYGPSVDDVHGRPEAGKSAFPNVGHFFAVIDIARFLPLEEFGRRMEELIERLKASRKAADHETIYVHGEREWAFTLLHRETGVPISDNVFRTLAKIGAEVGVAPPPVQPERPECEGRPAPAGETHA